MLSLEKNIDLFVDKFLIPAEKIWQPTDFLPNSQKHTFIAEVEEIRELQKDLHDDFRVVLVGDTITEEALPTYESWLLDIDGIEQNPDNGWAKWVRTQTAEENRHGDFLNKYLYGGIDKPQELLFILCLQENLLAMMSLETNIILILRERDGLFIVTEQKRQRYLPNGTYGYIF